MSKGKGLTEAQRAMLILLPPKSEGGLVCKRDDLEVARQLEGKGLAIWIGKDPDGFSMFAATQRGLDALETDDGE